MTDEERVKRVYPNAVYTRVLSSPDAKREGMIVIESNTPEPGNEQAS